MRTWAQVIIRRRWIRLREVLNSLAAQPFLSEHAVTRVRTGVFELSAVRCTISWDEARTIDSAVRISLK